METFKFEFESETSKRESEGLSRLVGPAVSMRVASVHNRANHEVREPKMTQIRPDAAAHRPIIVLASRFEFDPRR